MKTIPGTPPAGGACNKAHRRHYAATTPLISLLFLLALLLSSPLDSSAQQQQPTTAIDQETILLRLFDKTNGLKWRVHTNWLSDSSSICDWYGVTCFSDDEVDDDPSLARQIKGLDLRNNKLSGTAPAELFLLPHLTSIDFRDNPDMDFRFEGIESATSLEELALSATGLRSLEGIGRASNTLKQLHLTDNNLEGSIPDEIYSLTGLHRLFFNYNKFSGTLSSKIGNLKKLHELFLYNNDLTGQLPSEIGNLSELTILALSNNSFEGTLPTALKDLKLLQIVALQRQRHKGGMGIGGQLINFSNLPSLRELYLAGNRLTGSIPDTFLQGDSPDLQEVVKVDLSMNDLTGVVPASLERFERMQLILNDNKFRGIAEELCSKNEWMGGDVRSFQCMAIMCPIGYYNVGGGRQATEDEPCQKCPENTEARHLGATKCKPVTQKVLSQRDVLELFYESTDGHFWKVRENWLSETVSECGWYGITCENNQVVEIALPNNELSGKLPSEALFNRLPSLKRLDFTGNFIDASFAGIGNATKLTSLVLASTGLSSMDGIGKAQSLINLNLQSNAFKGPIRNELFSITSLEHLFLSHNSFSGSLSSSVGNMKNLQSLHCYGCSLSGSLPSTLGELAALRKLDLSENDFTGELPTELNQLTNLRLVSLHQTTKSGDGLTGPLVDFASSSSLAEIYLDANSLTGTVPSSLLSNSELTAQKVIIGLSQNQLEGSIPSELQRFDKLTIDLSDNKITAIPEELCAKSGWMGGWVSQFGCAAVLCPAGTYNQFGRQTKETFECQTCDDNAIAPFFGGTKCLFGDSEEDGAELSERDILAKFYYLTGGHGWEVQTNWLSENLSVCEWHGVICYHKDDMQTHVRAIILRENGLSGTFPTAIFKLPYLEELNLRGNAFSKFSFEGIENALMLHNLTLSETGLTSIEGIGNAPALKSLHLTDNHIKGTIPEELFNLVHLSELYLNFNRFSGRLSSKIGNLHNLVELFLFHNELTGQLPASIGKLNQLKIFTVAKNKLEGTLPEELNELTSLEILSLEGNGVDGGIKGPLLDFSSLPNLQQLFLNYNKLTGTIPETFLSGVTNKFKDLKVDLISNELQGILPASLSTFQKLRLYVADNEIEGISSELCLKDEWMGGNVQDFSCDAIACPPNTHNSFGRQSDSNIPCEPCEDGTKALFYGSLECITDKAHEGRKERDILEEFYRATGGESWSINTNWMNDEVSICEWHGVTCENENVESVESLHLSKNSLTGATPSSLFSLPQIQEINLSDNNVSFSFDGVEDAKNLNYLNLDATGLTSLSGLEKATSLTLLHINENDFDGSIPTELFSLANLEVLFLSANSFSGELPEELRNLSNLRFFDVSNCGLSGHIPEWMGDLTALEYLRLDQNSFSGELPFALSTNLVQLEHLDISDQKSRGGKGLEGGLPDFSLLGGLTELVLRGNALTGQIPSSLMENADLDSVITIDLRDNRFQGHVPTHLKKFKDLKLYLAGNMIDEMSDVLCAAESLWLNGDVAEFGCDGLMCPPGTYNPEGRRSDSDQLCQVCESPGTATYFGSTKCQNADSSSHGGNKDDASTGDSGSIADSGSNKEYSPREILTHFYKQCGGSTWTNSTNWLTDKSVCEWHGIECYNDGSNKNDAIKTINLRNNKLHDIPPHLLFHLPHLRIINLKENPIQFSFTGIQFATKLVELKLSDTGLTSVSGISKAPALKILHLTGNDLQGNIPNEIYQIKTLTDLYMNYNQLSGTISPDIGNLVNLEELYLFHNSLTGQLPSELGKLTNLRMLALSMNNFAGTLPPEMNDMSQLEILSLQREGVISGEEDQHEINKDNHKAGIHGPLLDFARMPRLKELYLGSNQLSGTIPETLLQNLSDKSSNVKIDLTMNQLSGSIPAALTSFDKMKLYLSGNHITAIPDNVCQKGDWMGGEVDRFDCDAILCPPGTYNEFGRQSMADVPCEPCNEVDAAAYYGSVDCKKPKSMDNLSEIDILKLFYKATDGDNWDDNYQWLSGDSPCMWQGITCGDNGKVTSIDLSSNNLSGTPPSELFQLPSLLKLDLHDNNIDFSFEGIASASQLTQLDLSSTKVKYLNGISGVANKLRILNLQGNDFGGAAIPEEVFALKRLKSLYLSGSGFAGPLPQSIGNMNKLQEFYCTDNALTGTIPKSIGNLEQLKVLALSENDWSGTIPNELNQLPSLKKLYIDNFTREGGGLTGTLPDFSNLPYLNELYLGFNDLTGTIPDTLLGGIKDPMQVIKLGLNSNAFSGTIPSTLSHFKRLSIDIAGNKIESVPDELCEMSEWMQGSVDKFSCDALLCPPGTFNLNGRQSTSSQPCQECERFPSPYYGSKECGSEAKAKEKEILVKFYHSCGGNEWKRQDQWLDDNVDYCEWYGVSCDDNGRIESILLGSNNVVGTPPAEIFDIVNLKWLWLYSNPISFQFDGIGNAKQLSSLLLDSTGLVSTDGIEAAANLVEIDLRFNHIEGPFPDVFFSLQKLESLSLSDNAFTGSLSSDSFDKLPNLKKLRLGSNHFTGPLPDFASQTNLRSLDLSNNELTGTIPDTLLRSVQDDESSEGIFIDLSTNQLTGTVPGGISRFEKLTIYLRDNLFDGVDPTLCTKDYWNDGDVEDFGCDGILCPAGTYASLGRQSKKKMECEECPTNSFAGSTECLALQGASDSGVYAARAGLWSLGITLATAMWLLNSFFSL